MKKTTIVFFGASVTQQAVNREGVKVGYVPHTIDALIAEKGAGSFEFHQLGYGANHFDDAGFIYFQEVLDLKPDLVILEWHTTGLGIFDAARYDHVIHELERLGCKVLNLVLPFKRCIGRPERDNVKQTRWYQRQGVHQLNFYPLLGTIVAEADCLRDEVHTTESGGKTYAGVLAPEILRILEGIAIATDPGEEIEPSADHSTAPVVTSWDTGDLTMEASERLMVTFENASGATLFGLSTVGPHSPLLSVDGGGSNQSVSVWDQWCNYDRVCLKPFSNKIELPEGVLSIEISERSPDPANQTAGQNVRSVRHLKKLHLVGGRIVSVSTAPVVVREKIKVLIFANCHGVYYQSALSQADKTGRLEIDHVISYENLANFEKLRPKFSSCDILIIQPVSNYDDFKEENLKRFLKNSCHVIRVPFVRFNGFWDPADIRDLDRFTKAAVMFFPKISDASEVDGYLAGEHLDENAIKAAFEASLVDLKKIEDQGNLEFYDFFIENHRTMPMFRDAWHPSMGFLNFLSAQIVRSAKQVVNELVTFNGIATTWKKEYGHFKPITTRVADTLGLQYDLDGYYRYNRKDYLETLINHENHGAVKIESLEQLKPLLDHEEIPATPDEGMGASTMSLFTPFYKSQDEVRQLELVECLRRNVANKRIQKIYLLIDDGHVPEIESAKIEVIAIQKRPTYRDWIKLTAEKCKSGISILANTDIYLDDSVSGMLPLLEEGNAFVALSRYEVKGDRQEPHKNPKWSQDVWAIRARISLPAALVKSLDIPLGVPRCDNKVAYLFAVNGFTVYNPFHEVRSFHLHESQLRGYNKRNDRTVLGGVAYVYPCSRPGAPSAIEMQIWGVDSSQVVKTTLNRTIEDWEQARKVKRGKLHIPAVDCILIPLIRREMPDLVRYLQTMLKPSTSRIRLVLSIDTTWDEEDKKVLTGIVKSPSLDGFFSDVEFISCGLTAEESIYFRDIPKDLKTRDLPSHGLKNGPNKQFFVTVKKLLELESVPKGALLQEVDTIPLRDHWIDFINDGVANRKDALLIGATCSSVVHLSDDLAHHVNGNAILCCGNATFPRFMELWEKVLLEVVKKAPWKAYDSATEWALHYRERRFESTFDGRQLAETPFFSSSDFKEYVRMYNQQVHRTNLMLNLADETRSKAGFFFDFNVILPHVATAAVLHLRAALPHRDILRAVVGQTEISSISYDSDWQYPAITEQHAAWKAGELVSANTGSLYFGFPWATLVDKMLHKPKDAKPLLRVLQLYAPYLKNHTRIATVCQHVYMLKFQDVFHEIGITHVFWSHAVKGQPAFPDHPDVQLLPFPLYPVQRPTGATAGLDREYLYSFVGAKSPNYYLTESRNKILKLLSDDPGGYVRGRDAWHYKQIVYDFQVRNKVDDATDLVCNVAADEFKEVLLKSMFSLCPSGTGPNSIRLWESIAFGSIPVILADTYLPPGDRELWEQAAVFCRETDESITSLPKRLEVIAADKVRVSSMLSALRKIWSRYGPENFVHDIRKLVKSEEGRPVEQIAKKDTFLENLVNEVLEKKGTSKAVCRMFLVCFNSRMLSDGTAFARRFKRNQRLQEAFTIASGVAPKMVISLTRKIAVAKNFPVEI